MDVMNGVAQLLFDRLRRIIAAKLKIFVDRAGDDSDVQALGLPGAPKGEDGQALLIAVSQPLFETEAIALRLGDFLALFVEEHLIVEALGRAAADHAGNLARLDD